MTYLKKAVKRMEITKVTCLDCDDSIGEIPDDWSIGKVKYAFDRKKSKSEEKKPVVLSLARAGVKIRDISSNEGQLAGSYEGYNPVVPGDLLLNPMDLYSGANCSISKVTGVISQAYFNLGAKEKIEPRFYDYFFKTQYWSMAMFARGRGVSFDNRWTLNFENFKKMPIPMPDYDEQVIVADYLDDEITKIDKIIKMANDTIEAYEQWKIGTIRDVVTKGIARDRNYKASGIDWAGDIPIEWSCIKIKYASTISRGLFNHRPRNDERLYDGPYPFIQTGDVARAGQYITEYRQTLSEMGKNVSKLFPKGTLTMTIAANVGDVAILGFDAYFPDSVLGFIPKKNINNKYLYYIFSAMKQEFVRTAIVSTQLNLNIDRVKEMLIPITYDEDEQIDIVRILDEKCKKIDGIIKAKRTLIDNLEKYKKSLIFEVVTGKRKVV